MTRQLLRATGLAALSLIIGLLTGCGGGGGGSGATPAGAAQGVSTPSKIAVVTAK